MDRDFFVKVVFATHKVAALLPDGEEIKKMANKLLSDLLLFCEENPITIDQKRNILPRTLREIDSVLVALKKEKWANPKNLLVLEKEYRKIPQMLIAFLEENVESVSAKVGAEPGLAQNSLTARQHKILEFLKNKEKAQVWELQKILPEVTKRTLRRDLDNLLSLNLIERKGEWNNVFYTVK